MTERIDVPVSQICALTVFWSTEMDLVANSTPMVDLDSRLNSFRVKRDRTEGGRQSDSGHTARQGTTAGRVDRRIAYGSCRSVSGNPSGRRATDDFPTPESPMSTTWRRA